MYLCRNETCWHKGFFPIWPLQSYLSLPPHFHSFGLLQKITTITVTVIRLCVFCVLCRLHKWFIFVLAWAQPNRGLHCLVVFVLLYPATHCLTVNETVFIARLCFCVIICALLFLYLKNQCLPKHLSLNLRCEHKMWMSSIFPKIFNITIYIGLIPTWSWKKYVTESMSSMQICNSSVNNDNYLSICSS